MKGFFRQLLYRRGLPKNEYKQQCSFKEITVLIKQSALLYIIFVIVPRLDYIAPRSSLYVEDRQI